MTNCAISCNITEAYVHLASADHDARNYVRGPGILAPSLATDCVAACHTCKRQISFLSASDGWKKINSTYRCDDPEAHIKSICWNQDGSCLAVCTNTSHVLVLSRSAEVLHQWGTTSPWAKDAGVAAVGFGLPGQLLVLTAGARLHIVNWRSNSSPKSVSLKKHHREARCLAFHQGTGVLLVAGDGAEGGATISGWKLGQEGLKPLFTAGKLPVKPAAQADSAYPWSISFSPVGEFAVVAAAPGRLHIVSLPDGLEVQPYEKFAGRKFEARTGLSYFVRESLSSVVSASWWSPTVLALSDTEGVVSLASLPGFVNVLGEAPETFNPGTVVACLKPNGQERTLVVMEPLGAGHQQENQAGASNGVRVGGSSWRLVAMSEQSAEQRLRGLLQQSKWEEAAHLASQSGLDEDLVLRARWAAHPLDDLEAAQQLLASMKDQGCAVEECLGREARSLEAQQMLLQYVLHATAAALAPGGAMAGRAQHWWEDRRLQALRMQDRLGLLLAIYHGAFNLEAFKALCEKEPQQAASEAASASKLDVLQALLLHNPAALRPNYLALLSSIPETTDPHLYTNLLPNADGTMPLPPAPMRPADFIETVELASRMSADPFEWQQKATEPLLQLAGLSHPPTSYQVADWYFKRAVELDARSGQFGCAQSLLEIAVQRGVGGKVPGLLRLARTLVTTVQTRVTSRMAKDEEWLLGLDEYENKSEGEQLELLLADASASSVPGDITNRIIPFLEGLSETDRTRLVEHVLTGGLTTRPAWVRRLVELEAQQPRLLRDRVSLAQAVVAAVKASPLTDQWEALEATLDHATGALQHLVAGTPDVEAAQLLLDRAAGVKAAIKAAKLLQSHGMPHTVGQVLAATTQEMTALLRSLLFACTRTAVNEAEWHQLWRDLRAVAEGGATQLPLVYVQAEFCRALLHAGQFALAAAYMSSSVPGTSQLQPVVVEKLVSGAVDVHLDSAASLQDHAMVVAGACLDLMPPGQEERERRNLMEAVRKLPEWGVHMLPKELKAQESMMAVMERVAEADPVAAFEQQEELLHLASLLGLSKGSDKCQVKLLLASALLAKGHRAAAQQVGLQLVGDEYTPAWELCGRAGGEDTGGEEVRRRLLAFAAAHCPAEQLANVLEELQNCERRLLSDDASTPEAALQLLHDALQLSAPREPPPPIPSLGDVPLAVAVLATLPAASAAREATQKLVEAASAQGFGALQKAALVGAQAHLVRAVLGSAPAGTWGNPELADRVALMMELPVKQLMDQVGQQVSSGQMEGAEVAEDMEAARKLLLQLESASETRRLKLWMNDVDLSRFEQGDAEYRREKARQLAGTAGQMALQSSHQEAGKKLLQDVLRLASKYGLDAWELKLWYLHTMVASAPELSKELRKAIMEQEKDLLTRPTSFLLHLHSQLYPLLPASSPTHLSTFFSLLVHTLRALDKAGDQPEARTLTPHMEKLRDLLDKAAAALPRLPLKTLLNGPLHCMLHPLATSLAPRGAPLPGPPEAVSQDATAALFAYCTPKHVANLVRVLKNIYGITDAVTKAFNTAPAPRHLFLPPSLPYLLLTTKTLSTAATHHTPTPAAPPTQDAGYRHCRDYVAHMSAKAAAELARFLVMKGPQPVAEEAVGKLRPLPLSIEERRMVLQDALKQLAVAADKHKAGSGALPERFQVHMAPLQHQLTRLTVLQALLARLHLPRNQAEAVEACLVDSSMEPSELLQQLVSGSCSAASLLDVAGAVVELQQKGLLPTAGHGEEEGQDAPAEPAALVQASLMEVLRQALQYAEKAIGAEGDEALAAAAQDAVTTVETIVLALDADDDHPAPAAADPASDAAAAAVGAEGGALPGVVLQLLRDSVWRELQQFQVTVGAFAPESGVAAQLQEIQAAIVGSGRWKGWAPEEEDAASPQLLQARTQTLVSRHWAGLRVQPEDVASLSAAQLFFSRVLGESESRAQLVALGQLLQTAWKACLG